MASEQGSTLVREENLELFGFDKSCDEQAAWQAALELIHNSVDALRSSSIEISKRLVLTISNDPTALILMCEDNGPGVELDALFSSTKGAVGGVNPMLQQYGLIGRYGIGLAASLLYSHLKSGSKGELNVATQRGGQPQSKVAVFGYNLLQSNDPVLLSLTLMPRFPTTGTVTQLTLPRLSQSGLSSLLNHVTLFFDRLSLVDQGISMSVSVLETGEGMAPLVMTHIVPAAAAGDMSSEEKYARVLESKLVSGLDQKDKTRCHIHVKAGFTEVLRAAVCLYTIEDRERSFDGILPLEIFRYFCGIPVVDTVFSQEHNSCGLSTAVYSENNVPWKKKFGFQVVQPGQLQSTHQNTLSPGIFPVKIVIILDYLTDPPFANLRKTSLLSSATLNRAVKESVSKALGQLKSLPGVGLLFLSLAEVKKKRITEVHIPRVAQDLVKIAHLVNFELQNDFVDRLALDTDTGTEAEAISIIKDRLISAFAAKSLPKEDDEEDDDEEDEQEVIINDDDDDDF